MVVASSNRLCDSFEVRSRYWEGFTSYVYQRQPVYDRLLNPLRPVELVLRFYWNHARGFSSVIALFLDTGTVIQTQQTIRSSWKANRQFFPLKRIPNISRKFAIYIYFTLSKTRNRRVT